MYLWYQIIHICEIKDILSYIPYNIRPFYKKNERNMDSYEGANASREIKIIGL